ncbi:MAG TPA: hypothetical protein VM282_17670 [Acidimicrobiales bacterium]|nr:hypothetical protein [Acidimicrobiales bacterium]
MHRGIPHFIEGYAAGTDILTRVAPVLALVFVTEVIVLSFGDRFAGFVQALTVLGALALTLAVGAVVNRVRGRRPLQLPHDVGPWELALFVLVPAFAALVFGTEPVLEASVLFIGNLLFLGFAYITTSYGLVPMTLWAFGQLRSQLRNAITLTIKTLPLLLLFGSFFFLSTEIWQIADDFAISLYVLALSALVMLGALFIAFALRTDVTELSQFASWHDVSQACTDTPLAGLDPTSYSGPPIAPPLGRRARLNVALVMFVSQSIQVFLVAILTFVGLVGFGLVTVRETTLASWLGEDAITAGDRYMSGHIFGSRVLLSRQLVFVAGFVAAFAGLQFAVSVVNDAKYRSDFAEGMAIEVRQALAVRTAYLAEGRAA